MTKGKREGDGDDGIRISSQLGRVIVSTLYLFVGSGSSRESTGVPLPRYCGYSM